MPDLDFEYVGFDGHLERGLIFGCAEEGNESCTFSMTREESVSLCNHLIKVFQMGHGDVDV